MDFIIQDQVHEQEAVNELMDAQYGYVLKEDSSGPTVSSEALFLSRVIDAKENRNFAFVDVPGAFLLADMKDEVHVKFDGIMAKSIAKLGPSCTIHTYKRKTANQFYTCSS